MKRCRRGRPLGIAAGAALAVLAIAPAARAQITEATFEESEQPIPGRYHSPQHFAVELRFGPYRPDVDSEFSSRTPYNDFFGPGSHLLTEAEFDYELYHQFGTAAVGVSAGYFSVSGTAPFDTGLPSGDQSTLKVVPVALLGIYRFDYFLEQRNIPLVPFVKLGLNWAYWQITDGNGEIATDSSGGRGRGGTFGWQAAGGLALVLDMFDPDAAKDFDSDLGVNHTALTFQFVHADISGLGQSNRLHVGDDTWSAGLLVQF
jgi:hypothetical protein